MTKNLGCSKTMMPAVIIVLVILVFLPFETPAMKVKTSAGEDDQNPVVEKTMSSGHHEEEDLMNWAGYGEEKLSVVTVTGRVVCRDPCHSKSSDGIAQFGSIPVSGATVSISCGTKGSRKYRVRATTDENGDFFIEIPSHLHAIPNIHKFSFVKLLHLPKDSQCRPPPPPRNTRKQIIKGIKLLSTENGARAYVADTMHLTPRSSKACKSTGAV